MTKVCRRDECAADGEPQDERQFYRDSRYSGGLGSYCKSCIRVLCRDGYRRKRKELKAPLRENTSKERLASSLEKLIEASKAARSSGTWREKLGVRAYRDLGLAIEDGEKALHRQIRYSMTDVERETCFSLL